MWRGWPASVEARGRTGLGHGRRTACSLPAPRQPPHCAPCPRHPATPPPRARPPSPRRPRATHRSALVGTPTHTNTRRHASVLSHTPHTSTHTQLHRQTETPGRGPKPGRPEVSGPQARTRTHTHKRAPPRTRLTYGRPGPSEITADCLAGPQPPTHRHRRWVIGDERAGRARPGARTCGGRWAGRGG